MNAQIEILTIFFYYHLIYLFIGIVYGFRIIGVLVFLLVIFNGFGRLIFCLFRGLVISKGSCCCRLVLILFLYAFIRFVLVIICIILVLLVNCNHLSLRYISYYGYDNCYECCYYYYYYYYEYYEYYDDCYYELIFLKISPISVSPKKTHSDA